MEDKSKEIPLLKKIPKPSSQLEKDVQKRRLQQKIMLKSDDEAPARTLSAILAEETAPIVSSVADEKAKSIKELASDITSQVIAELSRTQTTSVIDFKRLITELSNLTTAQCYGVHYPEKINETKKMGLILWSQLARQSVDKQNNIVYIDEAEKLFDEQIVPTCDVDTQGRRHYHFDENSERKPSLWSDLLKEEHDGNTILLVDVSDFTRDAIRKLDSIYQRRSKITLVIITAKQDNDGRPIKTKAWLQDSRLPLQNFSLTENVHGTHSWMQIYAPHMKMLTSSECEELEDRYAGAFKEANYNGCIIIDFDLYSSWSQAIEGAMFIKAGKLIVQPSELLRYHIDDNAKGKTKRVGKIYFLNLPKDEMSFNEARDFTELMLQLLVSRQLRRIEGCLAISNEIDFYYANQQEANIDTLTNKQLSLLQSSLAKGKQSPPVSSLLLNKDLLWQYIEDINRHANNALLAIYSGKSLSIAITDSLSMKYCNLFNKLAENYDVNLQYQKELKQLPNGHPTSEIYLTTDVTYTRSWLQQRQSITAAVSVTDRSFEEFIFFYRKSDKTILSLTKYVAELVSYLNDEKAIVLFYGEPDQTFINLLMPLLITTQDGKRYLPGLLDDSGNSIAIGCQIICAFSKVDSKQFSLLPENNLKQDKKLFQLADYYRLLQESQQLSDEEKIHFEQIMQSLIEQAAEHACFKFPKKLNYEQVAFLYHRMNFLRRFNPIITTDEVVELLARTWHFAYDEYADPLKHYLQFYEKERATHIESCEAFEKLRQEDINNIQQMTGRNVIMVFGASGVGKTTYFQSQETTLVSTWEQFCHYAANQSQYHNVMVLFDEFTADVDKAKWAPFYDVSQGKLYINGHFVCLTDGRCTIALCGNAVGSGSNRLLLPAFQNHPAMMLFPLLPDSFYYKNILLDILARYFNDSFVICTIVKTIMQVANWFSEQEKEQTIIGAREIQHIAKLLVSLCEQERKGRGLNTECLFEESEDILEEEGDDVILQGVKLQGYMRCLLYAIYVVTIGALDTNDYQQRFRIWFAKIFFESENAKVLDGLIGEYSHYTKKLEDGIVVDLRESYKPLPEHILQGACQGFVMLTKADEPLLQAIANIKLMQEARLGYLDDKPGLRGLVHETELISPHHIHIKIIASLLYLGIPYYTVDDIAYWRSQKIPPPATGFVVIDSDDAQQCMEILVSVFDYGLWAVMANLSDIIGQVEHQLNELLMGTHNTRAPQRQHFILFNAEQVGNLQMSHGVRHRIAIVRTPMITVRELTTIMSWQYQQGIKGNLSEEEQEIIKLVCSGVYDWLSTESSVSETTLATIINVTARCLSYAMDEHVRASLNFSSEITFFSSTTSVDSHAENLTFPEDTVEVVYGS